MHKITQAVRPEMQAAITRVSETFSKLGYCTAEGLGFVLAAESAGGVQPAVPLVNMIKKVAGTVEAIEERGIEKIGGSSICKDIREAGSRYKNTATNVTKAQFENNLQRDGWNKSASKDGMVYIFEKDGARYVVRDNAKSTGGPTADYYKQGSESIDCRIRLGEE